MHAQDVTSDMSIERPSATMRVYRVRDAIRQSNAGYLFVEPYARMNSRRQWSATALRVRDHRRQTEPVVMLHCLAYKDKQGRALLHWEELRLLMREVK